MSSKWLIAPLIIIGIVVLVRAMSGQGHDFSPADCGTCHYDEVKDPQNIKSTITSACATCHSKLQEMQTHPTDVIPTLPIPKDMPLSEGKLTCITCHYIHPGKRNLHVKGGNFLRRHARGQLFCAICHEVADKDHIITKDVHTGHYEVTDIRMRIDLLSLECIECHDDYFVDSSGSLGAGNWKHFNKKFNHPIGISYQNISSRRSGEFHPASRIMKDIRLFDGKIGCGTCHNIYSKVKNMLVTENLNSRICLSCHIK